MTLREAVHESARRLGKTEEEIARSDRFACIMCPEHSFVNKELPPGTEEQTILALMHYAQNINYDKAKAFFAERIARRQKNN